jgi:hypothetical protein
MTGPLVCSEPWHTASKEQAKSMGAISGMVVERYKIRRCVFCDRDTRQRCLQLHPRWFLILTFASCGIFLPFLLLQWIGMSRDSKCLRCGKENGPPIFRWGRDSFEVDRNQYASGNQPIPKEQQKDD